MTMSHGNFSIMSHKLYLQLNSTTETYYKYKCSLIKHEYSQETDVLYGIGEPVQVFTNVADGFGVFAGYQFDIDTLRIE